MITLKAVDEGKHDEYELFIDGKSIGPYSCSRDYHPTLVIATTDAEKAGLLLSQPFSAFSELPRTVLLVGFPTVNFWGDLDLVISTRVLRVHGLDFREDEFPKSSNKTESHSKYLIRKKGSKYRIRVTIFGEPSRWRYPWSIEQYYREFQSQFSAMNLQGISATPLRDDNQLSDPEVRSYPYITLNSTTDCNERDEVGSYVKRYFDAIHRIHHETEKILLARLKPDSLVTYFSFPEQVRISCEQYLLYFVQFLQDLGVRATAEVNRLSESTVFTVTPTNSEVALGKIREALEVYAHLPSSSIINSSDPYSDIEIQRLVANIHHLKSQLTLASAVLQAKDATIESQQVAIELQRRILSGDVLQTSLKPKSGTEGGGEDLIEGLVTIKRYQGKGFEIDLPEVFRRLREFFSKERRQ